MDFQRVLQQSQSYLQNAPKQSDATKQLLEQGMNFQKTMSGERGIMAAIESAHLRPKIAAFIKGKLNGMSSDDVLNSARNIGTRLTGSPATRAEIAGPRAPPVVTENKVLAPAPNESGLVQEGGFVSLAPGRSIEERFGSDPVPSVEASRLTRGIDATNNPLNPRNIANVGQSETVPELDTPENLPGLRGAPAVSRQALAEADSGEVTSTRAASSLIAAKPVSTVKVLPTAEDLANGPSVGPALVRATPKAPAEPAQVSAGTPAPAVAAPEEAVGKLGTVGNPYRGSQAPAPPPRQVQAEDFPSPPAPAAAAEESVGSIGSVGNPYRGSQAPAPPPRAAVAEDFPSPPAPAAAAAAPPASEAIAQQTEPPPPPPARGMTDEALAERLSAVQEIGSGEEEASSVLSSLGSGIRSVAGAAGTAAEGFGVIQAFTQKGLTGQQRVGDVAQTLAPRAAGQVGGAIDEFGLPKGGTVTKPLTSDLQEQTDKALAEKLAAQTTTETEVAGAESEVPGIGDILALGTAIFGAVRGGVEAAKAKKEAEDYVAPPTANVAMDNAPTFDSSFR